MKDNPDDAHRSKSDPESDASMLATIKAVGIIQRLVVSPEAGGGTHTSLRRAELQTDGRLSNAEPAERCGMSTSACWRRTRRREEEGIIAR